MKFVPNDSINNIPALVQVMAWCQPRDKPLSEPIMANLQTYLHHFAPQWGWDKMAANLQTTFSSKKIVVLLFKLNQVYWHKYASLGLDELTLEVLQ